MKILAFDTSTENCSVTLDVDGRRFEQEILAGQRHSDLLLPMIQAVLQEAGCRLADLDGICYGAGPGSFTGLRIACGVAQGLALGAALPLVGISTLEALAQATPGDRVIAALDARMGEIYHAAFCREAGRWRQVSAPCVCRPEDAPILEGDHWEATGSGFKTYGEVLAARYPGQLTAIHADAFPQARDILTLALPRFAQGQTEDAAEATPIYVRNKVAKTIAEQKRTV